MGVIVYSFRHGDVNLVGEKMEEAMAGAVQDTTQDVKSLPIRSIQSSR